MPPVQIYYGPPFDATSSEFFRREVIEADLSVRAATVYLVPSHRKRRQVIGSIPSKQGKALPRIMVFEHLCEELYALLDGDLPMISPTTSRYIVFHLVQSGGGHRFPGFSREAYRHFAALRQAGITAEVLETLPDFDEDSRMQFLAALFREYDDALETLQLTDSFKRMAFIIQRLQAGGDPGIRLPWRRLIVDGFLDFTPLQGELIQRLASVMRLIMLWPGNPNQPEVYAPALNQLKLDYPHAEWIPLTPGDAPKRTLWRIGERIFSARGRAVSAGGALRVFQAATIRDEVRRIARDIKRRIFAAKQAGETLRLSDFCVTSPALKAYRPYFSWIFQRHGIPFNISEALPLNTSPVFFTIRNILRFAEENHRDSFINLVRDPLVTLPFPGEPLNNLRRLSRWMQKEKIATLPAPGESHAPDSPEFQHYRMDERMFKGFRTLAKWFEPLRKPDTFHGFLQSLRFVLHALKIHENLLEHFQSEDVSIPQEYMVRAYGEILKLFDDLDVVLERLPNPDRLDPAECRSLLFRIVADKGYRPLQPDADRVNILGFLETRGLTFRHLYVCGMNDSRFPVPERPGVFFRDPALLDELTGKTARDAEYRGRTDLIRLLMLPGESITFSWLESADDAAEFPSFLLYHVFSTCSGEAVETLLQRFGVSAAQWKEGTRELAGKAGIRLVDDDGGSLNRKDALEAFAVQFLRHVPGGFFAGDPWQAMRRGGFSVLARNSGIPRFNGLIRSECALDAIARQLLDSGGVTVSDIDAYLRCPMRFLLERLCRLETALEYSDAVTPPEKGNYIHDILKQFYSERIHEGRGRIMPEEVETAAERCREIAETLFRERFRDTPVTRQEKMKFKGNAALGDPGLAHRFAAVEAAAQCEFDPLFVEWPFSLEIPLHSPSGEPPAAEVVSVRGRIDRIDGKGNLMVVYDYKTGAIPSREDVLTLRTVQLGLYLAAVRALTGAVPAGALYYTVSTTRGCRLQPMLLNGDTPAAECFPGRRVEIRSTAGMNDYICQAETCAAGVIGNMLEGTFSPVETNDLCARCPFFYACRRASKGYADE